MRCAVWIRDRGMPGSTTVRSSLVRSRASIRAPPHNNLTPYTRLPAHRDAPCRELTMPGTSVWPLPEFTPPIRRGRPYVGVLCPSPASLPRSHLTLVDVGTRIASSYREASTNRPGVDWKVRYPDRVLPRTGHRAVLPLDRHRLCALHGASRSKLGVHGPPCHRALPISATAAAPCAR
jgi:hypothetical protein